MRLNANELAVCLRELAEDVERVKAARVEAEEVRERIASYTYSDPQPTH